MAKVQLRNEEYTNYLVDCTLYDKNFFYITLSTLNSIHNLFPKLVTSTDFEIYTVTYHNATTNPKMAKQYLKMACFVSRFHN